MGGRQRSGRAMQSRRQQGFTTLELVVTMSIFLIVLFAVYSVYEVAQATYVRGATDIDLRDQARRALTEMEALTRLAGYDPKDAGIFGFRSWTGFTPVATESTLLFSLDADEDGVIDSNSHERMGFALFGTELRRTMDGTTPVEELPPIARNVQSIRFSYFDRSELPIPNPPEATYSLTRGQMLAIRRITIDLTLSSNGAGTGPRVYTLFTDLRPRNL